MALRSDSVYGILGAQMLAVLASGEGPYRCWLCGDPGPSTRKPAPGVPFYCSEQCRTNARRETYRKSKSHARQKSKVRTSTDDES
jgi:hypothetical protein